MDTILIADSNFFLRTGLKALIISSLEKSKIHEAGDGGEVIHCLQKYKIDLLILGISIPGISALELLEFVKCHYKTTRVLIYARTECDNNALMFIQRGAKGFISKDASLEKIVIVIKLLLKGKIYYGDSLKRTVDAINFSNQPANPFHRLSRRELEIIFPLLSGKTPLDISSSLNLRPSTIGTFKARAFKKLKLASIFQLKVLAGIYEIPQAYLSPVRQMNEGQEIIKKVKTI